MWVYVSYIPMYRIPYMLFYYDTTRLSLDYIHPLVDIDGRWLRAYHCRPAPHIPGLTATTALVLEALRQPKAVKLAYWPSMLYDAKESTDWTQKYPSCALLRPGKICRQSRSRSYPTSLHGLEPPKAHIWLWAKCAECVRALSQAQSTMSTDRVTVVSQENYPASFYLAIKAVVSQLAIITWG